MAPNVALDPAAQKLYLSPYLEAVPRKQRPQPGGGVRVARKEAPATHRPPPVPPSTRPAAPPHRPAPGPPAAIGARPTWDSSSKTFYGVSVGGGEFKRAEREYGGAMHAAEAAQQQVAALNSASGSAHQTDYEAISKARDKARELKKLADHREGTQRALLERLLKSEKRYEWQQKQLMRVSTQLAQVRSRLATVASERDAALDAARIAAEESDALRGENELLRDELLRAHSLDPGMPRRTEQGFDPSAFSFAPAVADPSFGGRMPSPSHPVDPELSSGWQQQPSGTSSADDLMVGGGAASMPAVPAAEPSGSSSGVAAAAPPKPAVAPPPDSPKPEPPKPEAVAPPPEPPKPEPPKGARRAPPPFPEAPGAPPALPGGEDASLKTDVQMTKDASGYKVELTRQLSGAASALADDAATDAATEAYLDMKFGAMANYDAVKPKPKADAPAERKRPSVTLKADLVSDVAQLPMDMESVAARTSWETKDEEELMREEAEDAAAEQAELEAPMGLAGLSDMGAAAAAPPIGGAACAACAPSLGGGKKKSATNPFGI